MKRSVFLFLLVIGAVFQVKAQDSLNQFTGKYVFDDKSPVREVGVVIENGALKMTSAMGDAVINKIGEDLFEIPTFSGTAQFKRDTNKKVTGVVIVAMGFTLEGTRTTEDGAHSSPIIIIWERRL